MKTQGTLKPQSFMLIFIAIGLMILAMAPASRAGLAIPYTADPGTLHLWHLNTTNNWQTPDSQSNNLQTTPMTLVVTPGKTNYPYGAPPTQFPALLPGEFPALGSGIQFTQYTCLYGPYNVPTNSDGTTNFVGGTNPGDGCSPINTNITDYANPTTGAFTWEAVMCPQFNVLNPPYITQLISGDSGFPARSWQLRLAAGHLEYIDNISSGSKTYDGNIPSTGPDAAVVGGWYHVALAFSGTAPTNGDAPNKLTMYWTRLDPSRTNATAITNFSKTANQTGSTFLCISGVGRANIWNNVGGGAGFQGIIQEIRMSSVCRKPNEMAFNSTISSESPIFVLQPNPTALVGYGQTLTIQATAFGSPTPAIVWSQNGTPVPGQTNSTLVISNAAFGAAGTYVCSATNSVGGTNSTSCVVAVGAAIDGLYSSGVDDNGNLLYPTAAGLPDPHYYLEQTADPFSTIPNAIIWANAAPLSGQGGSYAPMGATAGWIGPEKNGGQGAGTAGTYVFETHFYIDQGDPNTANVTGSIIPAYGTASGSTITLTLNGTATNIVVTGNPLTTPVPFAFTSANGLILGSNTLDFTLPGAGSAAVGIQVQLSGICTNALAPGLPVITNQPGSEVVPYGSTVIVPVVALGQPPLSYQWYSNGIAINPVATPSAATRTLTFVATNFSPSEVVGTNFLANYTVAIGNASGFVTSQVATVTITIPGLSVASAGIPMWNPTNNETNVVVIFTKTVDPATAASAANYTLNNGASVNSATVVAPNEVVLTTSVLNPVTAYMLTVQNVNDFLEVPMQPVTVSVGSYPVTALLLNASSGITADSGGVNTWNDLSGNGNSLTTIFGPPTEPQLVTNALHGVSVQFNPINNALLTASSSPSLQIVNDISIVAVVSYASLAGGTNGMIVSKTTGSQPHSYDYYTGANFTRLLRGNGTVNASVSSTNAPSALNVGDPHLLDVVMQGSTVTERLDGTLNGTGTLVAPMTDGGDPLFIGTRADAGNHLNGCLSELIIVPSALSPFDVSMLENYLGAVYDLPLGTNSYPLITQQPVASTNVNQNSTLSIPAAASGNPAVAYQWYDMNNNPVAGQTSAILAINNIQANNSYYLIVTNIYGTATSSVVNVTLNTGLNVTLGPSAVTTYIGQGPTLSAVATGTAPFYYQWTQNGSPITGATNSNYAAIATAGTVNYSCTVSNLSGNSILLTNAGPVALTGIVAPTNLYQTTVLGNHPIAFWQLAEGPDNGAGNGGVIAHDYVAGHNAVYTNVILGASGFSTLSSTDTAVVFGEYPPTTPLRTNSFAGEIYNSGLTPVDFSQPLGSNGELTVEAWVVSSNSSPVGGSAIVAKGYGNGGEQFDLDLDPGFRFLVRDASGAVHGPTLATAPTVGQWNHVVGVFDGANGAVHLYVNGIDVADTTGFGSGLGVLKENLGIPFLPQASYVSIGSRTSASTSTNFNFNLQGRVDDVALYNYALTPAQVQSDYLAGSRNLVFNTTPTNITFSVTANALTLSWPANHTGWQLQGQTNALSVGINTNWVNVNNTTGTNSFVVPMNLTNGAVFYRLIFP